MQTSAGSGLKRPWNTNAQRKEQSNKEIHQLSNSNFFSLSRSTARTATELPPLLPASKQDINALPTPPQPSDVPPPANCFDADFSFQFPSSTVCRYATITQGGRAKYPVRIRNATEVARAFMLHAQGRALACPALTPSSLLLVSEKGAKGLKACKEAAATLHASCGVSLGRLESCTETPIEETEISLLASLLSFALRCRLLHNGVYIHCGELMQQLLDSRVLSQQPSELQNRAHINCPGFSFGVRVLNSERQTQKPGGALKLQGQLRVLPCIYRVLPLKEKEEIGRRVYCLPRLVSPATLEQQEDQPPATAPLKSKEDFIMFWLLQHGYKLPESALRLFVRVNFNGHLELSYPQGCCWREAPLELRRVSAQVKGLVAARAFHCLSSTPLLHAQQLTVSNLPSSLPLLPPSAAAPSALLNAPRKHLLPAAAAAAAAAGSQDVLQQAEASAAFEELNQPTPNPGQPHRQLPPPCLARRVHTPQIERRKSNSSSDKTLAASPQASATTAADTAAEEQPQEILNSSKQHAHSVEVEKENNKTPRLLPPPATYSRDRLAATAANVQHLTKQQKQQQQQQQKQQPAAPAADELSGAAPAAAKPAAPPSAAAKTAAAAPAATELAAAAEPRNETSAAAPPVPAAAATAASAATTREANDNQEKETESSKRKQAKQTQGKTAKKAMRKQSAEQQQQQQQVDSLLHEPLQQQQQDSLLLQETLQQQQQVGSLTKSPAAACAHSDAAPLPAALPTAAAAAEAAAEAAAALKKKKAQRPVGRPRKGGKQAK